MAKLKMIDRNQVTGTAKELLDKVRAQFGVTPNFMRYLANSPEVLGSYVNFYTALASGLLNAKLHDQIAIVVAEANGCEYCLSAYWRTFRARRCFRRCWTVFSQPIMCARYRGICRQAGLFRRFSTAEPAVVQQTQLRAEPFT